MKNWLSVCLGLLLVASLSSADTADRAMTQTDPKEAAAAPAGTPVAGKGAGGPDAFGYRWIDSDEPGGPAYNWIDITGTGTALNLTDDGEANITLPFAFSFYGVSSTNLRIGNNGGILFNATAGDVSLSNYPLPSRYYTLQSILPFIDDIDSDIGNVYWEVQGTEPNRQLIVEWYNRPHYSNYGSVTFEAILSEGTNEIKFQYADVVFDTAAWNYGASATVGIQGDSVAANNWYLQYSHLTASLHDNMAIRFYTYNPQPGDLALASIDAPAGAVVPPSVAFTPTVTVGNPGTTPASDYQVVYTIDDGSKALVYTDTVLVSTPDSLIAGADTAISFSPDFTPLPFTEYNVTAFVTVTGDPYPANDTARLFFRTWDRDVAATAIVAPTGYVAPDAAVNPQVSFHNYATETSDFDVYLVISQGGSPVYSQTLPVTGLAAGNTTTVTFPGWTVPTERHDYDITAWAVLAHDLNAANDTITGTCTSLPVWAYVTNVPDGGGAYTRWSYSGSCVSNGLLWLVAGRRDASWAVLNNVGTYDPATDTWNDARPVVNQARVYLTAAGNDQYVFALGGRSSDAATIYANNERLDSPSGSAWTTMAAMPAGRAFGAAVADDQYVYYLGGTSDAGATTPTTTLWRYDIAGDTVGGTPWNQGLSQIPAPMNSADATLMDGKIYVLGDATYNTTYVYDIAGDAWDSIPNGAMGAASMYEAVSMYGKVWRIGGILAASNASTNLVYELDPAAGTWTDAGKPMLQTRISFNAGFINGKVVAAGGVAFPGFTPTMTAEAIDVSLMGVSGKPALVTAPGTFSLYRSYPNPFSSSTEIQFQLSKTGRVNLAVYSVTGQLVKTLASGDLPAGRHSVGWNGKDTAGRAVSSGVYFYRLSASGANATGKLVVVR
ncbi:MAG: T9SS type A sorting domain-containing protein [Candidatus Edwardsbacteria bacterium]|jgi:hypothetical protein|nr:T9SS type A sorting domain-containing protein [Candidatus Edwardsbacteria bacterium]